MKRFFWNIINFGGRLEGKTIIIRGTKEEIEKQMPYLGDAYEREYAKMLLRITVWIAITGWLIILALWLLQSNGIMAFGGK